MYFDCFIRSSVQRLFQLDISRGVGMNPIRASRKKKPEDVHNTLGSNPGTGSIGPFESTSKNADVVETRRVRQNGNYLYHAVISALYLPIAKMDTAYKGKQDYDQSHISKIANLVFTVPNRFSKNPAVTPQILQQLVMKNMDATVRIRYIQSAGNIPSSLYPSIMLVLVTLA